jgi:hypothetical protein
VLDAPGNGTAAEDGIGSEYSCQICVSWPVREGFFGGTEPLAYPSTNEAKLELMKSFAKTWAEPFSSLVLEIPESTEVKNVELCDFAPPKDLRGTGRVVLMGDAFHAMAMCKLSTPTLVTPACNV